ncbi:MAG: DUF3352 domain-containing protein [Bacteroidota bacterium]
MRFLKRFFKWLFIALLLVVVAFAGYYFLWPQNSIASLQMVPHDAAVFIQAETPIASYKTLAKSRLWRHLIKNEAFAEIDSQLTYMDSLISENETMFDLLANRPLTVSMHTIGPDDWDMLYLVDLGRDAKLVSLTLTLKPVFRRLGMRIEEATHAGTGYLVIIDPEVPNEPLLLTVKDNLLACSYQRSLLHASIDAHTDPKLPDDQTFSTLREDIGGKKMFDFYFQSAHLARMLGVYSNDELLAEMGESFELAGMGFELGEQHLKLEGQLKLGEDQTNLLSAMIKAGTGKRHAEAVLPARTALYLSLGFDGFKDVMTTFEKQLEDNVDSLESYMADKQQIEDYLGISIEEHFLSWIDKEVAIALASPKIEGKPADKLLFLHAPDHVAAQAGLFRILKRIQRRTPVKFKPVEYRDYTIHKFKVKGFFKLLFGKLLSGFDVPYFTQYGDWIIFAEDLDVLQYYLDDADKGLFLDAEKDYRKLAAQFDDDSNVFTYIDMARLQPLLYEYLEAEDWRDLQRNREYLIAFRHIGFQLTGAENRTYDLRSEIRYSVEDVKDYSLYSNLRKQAEETGAEDEVPVGELYYGKVDRDGNVEVNLPDGLFEEMHPDGKLKVRAYVFEGTFEGDYREYWKNGNLRSQGEFSDGKRVGKWYFYNRRGKLKKTEVY